MNCVNHQCSGLENKKSLAKYIMVILLRNTSGFLKRKNLVQSGCKTTDLIHISFSLDKRRVKEARAYLRLRNRALNPFRRYIQSTDEGKIPHNIRLHNAVL